MQRGNVYPVQTDPTLHFTDAIAQNAGELEHVRLEETIAAGRHCRSIIRHLTILSTQQLAWEVVLLNRRAALGTTLAASGFLSAYRFTASEGKLYTGSAWYHYFAANVDLPYNDLDFENVALSAIERGGNLHLLLVNRSPISKLAGTAGALRLTLHMEPTYG
jgi:hypothetical protein